MRQRWPLYEAEDELIGPVSWYSSVEGCQFDVDSFIKRKWWRDRSPVRKIDIVYPVRGTGAVRLSDTHWRIEFSPKAMADVNLAHELAHVLMGVTPGHSADDHEQDHSAHFAGAELAIVGRLISADVGRRLQRAFEDFDVRYVMPAPLPLPEPTEAE